MTGELRRILVARGGAVGDFVLTCPVFQALRARFPGARLELLGHPAMAAVAQRSGLIDQVRQLEARQHVPLFAAEGELDAETAAYFASFDLILSYLHDPEGRFESSVRRVSSARFLRGPHRPDEAKDRHATAVFLEPLEQLGIHNPDLIPRLTSGRTQPFRAGCLAIHPGSGSPKKNWPLERWRELLNRLRDQTELHLLLVAGEAEAEDQRALAAEFPAARIQTAFHLPLPELAGELASCPVFLGHDSGITHLAAALGLRTIALWGPSRETIWRPLGDRVQIIRSPRGLPYVQVETVLDAVRNAVPSEP